MAAGCGRSPLFDIMEGVSLERGSPFFVLGRPGKGVISQGGVDPHE